MHAMACFIAPKKMSFHTFQLKLLPGYVVMRNVHKSSSSTTHRDTTILVNELNLFAVWALISHIR
jgi:hypothetical protein